MPYLTVRALRRGTFEVDVDGHPLAVADGTAGSEHGEGPSPAELVVAGLASSVATGIDDLLAHDAGLDCGLRVTAHYRLSSAQPPRVSSVDLTVNLPELPAERVAELKRVIQRCIAGATFSPSLEVGVVLVSGEPASTGRAPGRTDSPFPGGTLGPIAEGPNGSR